MLGEAPVFFEPVGKWWGKAISGKFDPSGFEKYVRVRHLESVNSATRKLV